jgi:Helix-loop-helix DNA-binding domain
MPNSKTHIVESAAHYIRSLQSEIGIPEDDSQNTLPVSTPVGPSEGLAQTSVERGHDKILERGPRNHISRAIRELELLLPETAYHSAKSNVREPGKAGLGVVRSKAAVIECAVEYLKALLRKPELRSIEIKTKKRGLEDFDSEPGAADHKRMRLAHDRRRLSSSSLLDSNCLQTSYGFLPCW